MVQERGAPLRILIENVPGCASYTPGGFVTGAHFGSGVGVVAKGTSNIGGLRVVLDAMGQGLSLMSGAPGFNSGFTSGVFYTVQSAGISGNQVGIRCFNPVWASGGVAALGGLSGGESVFQECQSGTHLGRNVFKVLVQGY